MKKYKIKEEQPEASSGRQREKQNDLAYFIHDRVELLHQVFSLLKPKEIKAMAPDCVRDISLDDLQELCLEELLGISSKRLLSALDGAPPPSDTESSSDDTEHRRGVDNLGTISLDSISSDEGALSPGHSSKRSKKHKRCKRREKRKKSDGKSAGGERERAAERAGLTVLELLELQARARAIRAQLNAEIERKNALASAATVGVVSTSDDDVEIKEEPAEVVELVSSDDDAKPDVAALQATLDKPAASTQPEPPPAPAVTAVTEDNTRIVTKRADLTIVVPKAQPTRKIKLNRQKSIAITAAPIPSDNASTISKPAIVRNNAEKEPVTKETTPTQRRVFIVKPPKSSKKDRAKKKKKPRRTTDAEGSDHDEITLQLSDSEKMDLLEDFDRKNYDQVSSSSSEDDSEDSGSNISSERGPVATNHGYDSSVNTKENSIDTRGNQTENKVDDENKTLTLESGAIEGNSYDQMNASVTEDKDSSEKPSSQAEIHTEDDTAVKNISALEEEKECNTDVKEKATELESTAQESLIDQQSSCNKTENNIISAKEKDDSTLENNVIEASKNGESCDNNATATSDSTYTQSSEVTEVLSSEIDTALTENVASDMETSKKSKNKKKSKKKEKKSKKEKKM